MLAAAIERPQIWTPPKRRHLRLIERPKTEIFAAVSYVTSFVATGVTGTATTIPITVPAAGVPVGDFLVLVASGGVASQVLTGVTDSRGNTWTVDKTVIQGTNTTCSIARCNVTTALVSADVITATYSATSGGRAAVVGQYRGITSSTPFDSVAAGSNTTAAATTLAITGAATTTQNIELCVAGFAIGTGTAPVAVAPYVQRNSATSAGTVRIATLQDTIVFATGTQASTQNWTTSGFAAGCLCTYKADLTQRQEQPLPVSAPPVPVTFAPVGSSY